MFILWTVAGLVMTLCGQIHTGEIFGGREAGSHSRPYMVLLKGENTNGPTEHCGGFLLTEDFVMTAAHCRAKSYKVSLGAHNYWDQNGVQRLSVAQDFPHEGYKEFPLENDIMLLKLSTKAKFSDTVKPITLSDWESVSLPKSCMIAGWGLADESNGKLSPLLREVNVTLIPSKLCELENTYCSEGEKRPGRGDSGGPLVCEDGKAFGVISACIPQKNCPIICYFTKIQAYKSWITSTIKNARKV